MRKVISCCLFVFILLAAGCGGPTSEPSANPSGDSAPTQNANSSNGADNATEELEPVTINVNVLFAERNNNDPRYDLIREKFGINFELIACSLNDVRDKVRIWVAGGDMPEVMWCDMQLQHVPELKSWVQGGAIRELPDMSKYPNLKAIREAIPSYDVLQVDGKDYYWLGGRGLQEMDNIGPEVYLYRKDWAKQLGMDKESFTWDEMVELAEAFVQQDPGGNGAGKTIGLACVGWAYPNFLGIERTSPSILYAFKKTDSGYQWVCDLPETLEGIKIAKDLHDRGIAWQEQSLAQNFDGPSKFQAGQVGILYHNMFANNVASTAEGMAKALPGVNVDEAIGVMKLKSKDGHYYKKEIEEYWGVTAFRSDIDETKLDRFLTMHDWLNSDEGMTLRTYGIEGKDFSDNGTAKELLWQKDENGNFVSPYETESDRLMNMFQLTEVANYSSPLVPDVGKKLAENVLSTINGMENPQIIHVDRNLLAFSAPNKDKYNIIQETREKLIELIVGSNNIEADYAAWVASMRPKVDPILVELNAGLS
jgi:ABC-type glycerol-3-phosphate transport system substrate-binding protein